MCAGDRSSVTRWCSARLSLVKKKASELLFTRVGKVFWKLRSRRHWWLLFLQLGSWLRLLWQLVERDLASGEHAWFAVRFKTFSIGWRLRNPRALANLTEGSQKTWSLLYDRKLLMTWDCGVSAALQNELVLRSGPRLARMTRRLLMQHHALPTHRCLLLRDSQDLRLHHLDLAAHLLIL